MINMKNKTFLFSNLFLYELKSLLYNPSTYLFQLIFNDKLETVLENYNDLNNAYMRIIN